MTSLCRVICPTDQVQFSTSVALNSLRNWFILEVWFCLFTRAQFTVFWSLSLLTFPHDCSTIFILLKWSAVQTTYYTTCLCLPDDNYCLWRNMSSMAYSIESDQAIIPPSTCSNWNYLSINQTSLLAGVGSFCAVVAGCRHKASFVHQFTRACLPVFCIYAVVSICFVILYNQLVCIHFMILNIDTIVTTATVY